MALQLRRGPKTNISDVQTGRCEDMHKPAQDLRFPSSQLRIQVLRFSELKLLSRNPHNPLIAKA